MIPWIALAAGAILGALLVWLAAKSGATETRLRAESLFTELAVKAAALETAQRERSAAEAASNERDAKQRAHIAGLEATHDHLKQQIESLHHTCTSNEQLKDQLREESTTLKAQVSDLIARTEAEQKNSEKQLALLTGARTELSNQFEALANKILEEKSLKFTAQNETNMGRLLGPLKDKFGEFQGKVESLEKDGLTGRTELKGQIDALRSLNERLSQDATNLVSALRGSSKTQGDWGEHILESILESSGFRKGFEYRVQESFTREDRTRARLDVIIDLPESRHLVLDSKVSLNDYNDASSADNEPLREAALSRHLASVRAHIRGLSQRDYHSLYGLNSLDFVIMFFPIEPAFLAAISRDNKLWLEAWEKSILLVSPSTLLFVLRTVSQLWRQEQQTKNVQEIVKRGGELYDKLSAFANDLTAVGSSLEKARESYDEAFKKLAQGKGNAIRQAELLKGLGVKPTKSLPAKLLELSLQEENSQGLELAAESATESEEAPFSLQE